jgi:hypothetical protein
MLLAWLLRSTFMTWIQHGSELSGPGKSPGVGLADLAVLEPKQRVGRGTQASAGFYKRARWALQYLQSGALVVNELSVHFTLEWGLSGARGSRRSHPNGH